MTKKPSKSKSVETIAHSGDTRSNIPTAEYEGLMRAEDKRPIALKYPRNTDLDPQLMWRGKDEQDWSDLVVPAPPLYIQEKIHPKYIIDDLMRQSKARGDAAAPESAPALFAEMFDGDLDMEAKTEFYAHEQNWTNRMILGDSLQVMASLAEREGMRGQVQCIYFDPPYGIKFGSNWQVSTRSRDVKDGKIDQITREPEMVKAFRDTWSDGINSYLTYLRDRLTVARDMLHESGSIFVQIGDENVHRVRALLDEVFGDENFLHNISFQKTGYLGGNFLDATYDHILWVAKNKQKVKFNPVYNRRSEESLRRYNYVEESIGKTTKLLSAHFNGEKPIPKGERWQDKSLFSDGETQGESSLPFIFQGKEFKPITGKHWSTGVTGLERLSKADRIVLFNQRLRMKSYENDFPIVPMSVVWTGMMIGRTLSYVVETSEKVVERCLLMATNPGDLVLDPTCGSGTTATVAELLGRRWITIDTSRVALSLARARVAGAKFDYFFLADSEDGRKKEEEITGKIASTEKPRGNIKHGFVYERAPHITLSAIAHNAEIDTIWDEHQKTLEPLRKQLNTALKQDWQEWEIPREAGDSWNKTAKTAHANWWQARIARQQQIDASIARNADTEYLYDRPYVDNSKLRVAGPFTVESLSPHRVIGTDDDRELIENIEAAEGTRAAPQRTNEEMDFGQMVLENLRTAGVHQPHKEDRIKFIAVNAFPGKFISAEASYAESDSENAPQKRAAIFIGPEYGTLGRADIAAAAREASEIGFDVLITCAFNYDAHSAELDKLADFRILKARMHPDLHMAEELKNTGAGNLFVIFGEPDIEFIDAEGDQIQIKINGVDVFNTSRGEVIPSGPENIAAWFIDTDYNEESFHVRHAYFLGTNDPYKQLKNALKAEIDQEAWESLNKDTSRPFPKPKTGRIAVKVINHLGDEVMKVFNV